MTESPRWTPGYLNWRSYVDRRWKYAFYENGHEELFDLESDPYEQCNLATDDPARLEHCRNTLLAMLRETREPFFDVLIEHGEPIKQPVYYFPPPHPDMGFPVNWRDTDAMPGRYLDPSR